MRTSSDASRNMSDTMIIAEGLGKQYCLTRKGRAAPYQTLRESLVEFFKRPFGRTTALARNGGALPPAQDGDAAFWALRDVSFEVKRGEVVGVIGRNGAGKSTLLKILSRVTEPTAGRVVIEGRVCSLLEVGTGFHPELTGRENIFLNGAILGMRKAEIQRKFDEIVAFAEVEQFLDVPVKRYSSGMYVRLAFAVAAHLDPEILIVDEVLAVGDIHFQRKCLGKMKDVAKTSGRTVLFVSHNMTVVSALCQKAILLKEGRAHFQGVTRDAVSMYLSEGLQSSGVVSYPPDEAKQCQVVAVRVLDAAGIVTNRVDISDPFTVELEIAVRKSVKGACLLLSLCSEMEEHILQTLDCDTDPTAMDVRTPGIYRACVTIPGKILNSGKVNLCAGIAAPGGRSHLDYCEVMQLELADEASHVTRRAGQLRPSSLLLIQLPWKTRRVS